MGTMKSCGVLAEPRLKIVWSTPYEVVTYTLSRIINVSSGTKYMPHNKSTGVTVIGQFSHQVTLLVISTQKYFFGKSSKTIEPHYERLNIRSIPPEFLEALARSMVYRLQRVIETGGEKVNF